MTEGAATAATWPVDPQNRDFRGATGNVRSFNRTFFLKDVEFMTGFAPSRVSVSSAGLADLGPAVTGERAL
jgi:hypothetical protein